MGYLRYTQAAAAEVLDPTKRSVINLNTLGSSNDYLFIDHTWSGDGGWGLSFNSFTTSAIPYNLSIDTNGNMIEPTNAGEYLGNGYRFPASDQFTGAYVIDNFSAGNFVFNAGTWTEQNLFTSATVTFNVGTSTVTFGSSMPVNQDVYFTNTGGSLPGGIVANQRYFVLATGTSFQISLTKGGTPVTLSGTPSGTHTMGASYVRNANGQWTSIAGRNTYIVAKLTGTTGPTLMNGYCQAGLMGRPRVYRLEDEADLIAGRVFRRGAMQAYVDYNPGIVRFMDFLNVNNETLMRFEHRSLPTDINWQMQANKGPRYPAATGTNRYAVTTVTATGGFPASPAGATPSHGEVITCKIANAIVRKGGVSVTDISKHASAPVVSAVAHGYAVNDFVVHDMSAPANGVPGVTPVGMVELHGVPCKVMSVTTNTYTIGTLAGGTINSTGYSTFNSTQCTSWAWITMSRGSTGEYPITLNDGCATPTNYNLSIGTNQYVSLVFDAYLKGLSTITGSWVFRKGSSGFSPMVVGGAVPLEVCAKFMEELNALKGGTPSHMWVNIPTRGMCSGDVNYAAASNYVNGMIDVLINPSSTLRTPGWNALASNVNLYVEFSNETWNTGFPFAVYLARFGIQQFGGGGFNASQWSSWAAVRQVRDAKAAMPSYLSRIKFVLGGQGSNGLGYPNDTRLNGDANYWTNAGGSASPLSEHDCFATASYFDSYGSSGAWDAANISTMANAWNSHVGNAVQQEADCAAWLAGMLYTAQGGSQTVQAYTSLITTYDTAVAAQGKIFINYEGDWNHATAPGHYNWDGGNWGGTASVISNFMFACKASQAWGTGSRVYYDAFNAKTNSQYPAGYVLVGAQFGHTPLIAYNYTGGVDSYRGGVEGGSFDAGYQSQRKRNNGLSYP
jgi:hypothetical protein